MEDVLTSMSDEIGTERLEIVEEANDTLKRKYSDTWKQFIVYPKLMIEPDSLRIKIKFGKGFKYNDLHDRSDGLKQYISIKAFLAKKERINKPVLLVDEAEIHLHYSAQADLIQEFESQNYVKSIIYTTHSAGCLPSDLGSGIRVVEPIKSGNEDLGKSIIRNSIWENNIGFSPLLLAIGANVLAFTPARMALISEGVSDVILLPRMFREALKVENFDFQIVPGIASVSHEKAKELELEAAQVAYIVDGDGAGDELLQMLTRANISEEKIVQLNKNYTIEDFLKPKLLASAIVEQFKNMNLEPPKFNLNDLPQTNRIKWFEDECNLLNKGFPQKVRIADWIISNIPSDESIIEHKRIKQIKSIYNRIEKILKG